MGSSLHGRADGSEAPIVELPGPRESIPRATQFRSTWIVAGFDGLRQGGYFDRYAELVGAHREQLVDCVAGVWLPMHVVRAHYEACERLYISDRRYQDMIEAAAQVRRAWHAPVIAGAERAEATPWSVLQTFPRIWSRSADGGAVSVDQLAANRARFEYVRCELLEVPYFRRAVRVMNHLLLQRVCEGLVLQELPGPDQDCAAYLAQWA
jgi:hypothetical protein